MNLIESPDSGMKCIENLPMERHLKSIGEDIDHSTRYKLHIHWLRHQKVVQVRPGVKIRRTVISIIILPSTHLISLSLRLHKT